MRKVQVIFKMKAAKQRNLLCTLTNITHSVIEKYTIISYSRIGLTKEKYMCFMDLKV